MKTTAPLFILAMGGLVGCSLDRADVPPTPEPPAAVAAPVRASAPVPTVRPTRRRVAAQTVTVPVAAAASSGTSAPPAAVEGASEPPAPSAEIGTRQLAALPSPVLPVEAAPRPAVTPARLVGLDPTETTRLLGRPAETVEAPPALRWSWRTGSCTLRLFFFMDLKTRDFRALSYQTSGYDDANDADLRCLADVVAQADDPR